MAEEDNGNKIKQIFDSAQKKLKALQQKRRGLIEGKKKQKDQEEIDKIRKQLGL